MHLRSVISRWSRLLGEYLSAQAATQLMGVGAGILLTRYLPIEEFALYSLAMSFVTFFTFVTDLGATSSLLHFFRRVESSGGDFGAYVVAVARLRWTAFLLGITVVGVVFVRAGRGEGYSLGDLLLCLAPMALMVVFQVPLGIRLLLLRLESAYSRAYRGELSGAALRLIGAGALVVSGWLRAWPALLAGAAGALASFVAAGAAKLEAQTAEPTGQARAEVVRYLLPSLPGALYFSVQGPLVLWLCATFGSTQNIAEVGALGRLGMIVALFSGLASAIFLPRLSRIVDDRLYLRRFLQYGSLFVLVAAAVLVAAIALPHALLFVIGPSYSGLTSELAVLVAASGVGLVSSYVLSVNTVRSWTRWQPLATAVQAAGQVVLVVILPLGTTAGVLVFGLMSAVIGFLGQVAVAAIGFWRPRWVSW